MSASPVTKISETLGEGRCGELDARVRTGLWLGFLGVAGFSLTLPATKAAVASFPVETAALGRIAFAGLLSAAFLFVRFARGAETLPSKNDWRSIAICILCTGIGFPFLIAWALARTSSSHAAVVLALQPLATAVFSVLRNGERPSTSFWLASAAGGLLSFAYFLAHASGAIQAADLAILAAIALSCFGYVEAGRLTKSFGALRVSAWVSAVPLVLILPLFLAKLAEQPLPTSATAWLGLLYVGFVSQFLAAVPWFRGLALGGAARVGQVQLVQPFLTLGLSSWLLAEPVSAAMLGTAGGVVGCIFLAVRSRKPAR